MPLIEETFQTSVLVYKICPKRSYVYGIRKRGDKTGFKTGFEYPWISQGLQRGVYRKTSRNFKALKSPMLNFYGFKLLNCITASPNSNR